MRIPVAPHSFQLLILSTFWIFSMLLIQLNMGKKKITIQKWAEDLNIHFSKGNIQMAKRHMKRHLTSLVNREMQIKTTMMYHLTPVKMTIIKKSTNNQCWRGCGENGIVLHCWWECKFVQPLCEQYGGSLKH